MEPIKEHVSMTEHGKNSSKVLNVDELTELLNAFPLKCSNTTGIRTFGLVSIKITQSHVPIRIFMYWNLALLLVLLVSSLYLGQSFLQCIVIYCGCS